MNANFSRLKRHRGIQGFLLSASLPISLQNTFTFNTCNMILSFKRLKNQSRIQQECCLMKFNMKLTSVPGLFFFFFFPDGVQTNMKHHTGSLFLSEYPTPTFENNVRKGTLLLPARGV